MINFQRKKETFTFQDNEGNVIERPTEIRFDPLTNETSRIIFHPGLQLSPPDLTEQAKQTEGKNCPFCEENLLKMTPQFPENIAEEGRIFCGEAVVFPNLFPYSKHNGVTIFSKDHYVRLEQFTEKMIQDAFTAAQNYVNKAGETDSDVKIASINWNYLPFAGGSIIHPHIQVMISDEPTNYQSRIAERTAQFREKNGKSYFLSLCEKEKELGERWIGQIGEISWFHSFAPKSHNDFIAIFTNAYSIRDLKEEDWAAFAKGLKGIFAVLNEEGFASFNLLLHGNIKERADEPVHVRLIPRLTFGYLQTSDMNFFQTLHQEPLSYFVPEETAERAKKHFANIK